MRHANLPLAAAAALLCAGTAQAVDLGLNTRINIGVNAETSLTEQFRALDANNDGVITESEAEANTSLASMFDTYDKDNSGTLTSAEYKTSLRAEADQSLTEKAKAGAKAGYGETKEAAGKAAGAVKSGAKAGYEASKDAAGAVANKTKAGVSATADAAAGLANDSRKAAAASANAGVELSSKLAALFQNLDGNDDGVLTRTEASADADIESHFDVADDNDDDLLNKAEFKVAANARAESGLLNSVFGGLFGS